MKIEKIITTIAILYFILGFLFATAFAIYYKWEALSFLSPSFYSVILTWPFQAVGLLRDLFYYGIAGPLTSGSIQSYSLI